MPFGALIALVIGCAGVEVRGGDVPPCEGEADCLRPFAGCVYGSFDCNPAVDDVIGQISGLRGHGDALAFDRGVLIDLPTRSHHWQSVQRLATATGNYFVMSRSTSSAETSDLAIVEIASRGGTGMRLHSNAVRISPSMMAPVSSDDRIIAQTRVVSEHTHAGGTQLSGQVLAVPLEAGIPGSRVELFDMSDPAYPSSLGTVEHDVPDKRGNSGEAGTASLARLDTGRFVLAIGCRDARVLDFYLSTTTDIRDTEWVYYDRWQASELRTTIGDDTFGGYQNLNLVAGTDRRLYLVGTHQDGAIFTSQWIDLFVLGGSTDITLTKVAKHRMTCAGCNLDAGAGVYVAPSGELIVYSVGFAMAGDAVQAMEL